MTFKQYFLNEIALNMLTADEMETAKTYAMVVYACQKNRKLYKETGEERYNESAEKQNNYAMQIYQDTLAQGTDKKLFYNTFLKIYKQLVSEQPI
jgi:hypothetical protein